MLVSRRVQASVVGSIVALILALAAPASPAGESQAMIKGYALLTPDGTEGATSASAGSRPESVGRAAGVSAVAGQVGLSTVQLSASAGDVSSARAVVSARDVLLLDGRVAIASLRMEVVGEANSSDSRGGISSVRTSGVVIDGQPVSPGLGSRFDLAGVGTVVFFEQVDDGQGTVRANAFRLEASAAASPVPVGQTFVLGHVEATVRTPKSEPAVAPKPSVPAPEATRPSLPESESSQRPAPAKREPAKREPAVPTVLTPPPLPITPPAPIILPRRPVPTDFLAPTDARYVFPLHGQSSFVDTYGAPRATTVWHHGTDIFAPTGTPVLAVTDGTLSKVGVNRLGGNRLWLTDADGNEFYYAHLSAYAPSAINGAEVHVGEVIGFVGNTGDAITTPPHTHFEIHPKGGDSINPHPFLVAWQRRGALPLAFRAAAITPGPAPAAGAVLVGIEPASDRNTEDSDGLAGVAR